MDKRLERDSLGEISVDKHALWGAQTQRSLNHFNISNERFPWSFVEALLVIKKCAAKANYDCGKLSQSQTDLIVNACSALLKESEQDHFPLRVWQTGSGTQTNMNINEVIANKANLAAGSTLGSRAPIHPIDHVNRSQSSNDVFPTAMHLSCVITLQQQLIPALIVLKSTLAAKQAQFRGIKMVARTHWMDAVSMTVDEYFSGFVAQLEFVQESLQNAQVSLRMLAIGGSAVGNGLNVAPDFANKLCGHLDNEISQSFTPEGNKFAQISGQDAIANCHSQLKALATVLFKMANDFRFLSSGPRCGINELQLPANEPGSSIMPGKVNPTQCEALSMVCCQVFGNDVAVTMGSASGHMQLNVYRPMIIHNVLQSMRLLTDSMTTFTNHCLAGISLNKSQLAQHVETNLMDITAYAPYIGYDAAAKIAKYAYEHKLSIKQAASKLDIILPELGTG